MLRNNAATFWAKFVTLALKFLRKKNVFLIQNVADYFFHIKLKCCHNPKCAHA